MQVGSKNGGVIISGFLGSDAKYKEVGQKSTPRTSFPVKVDERGEEREAVWANCTCWRDLAERTASLRKGDVVLAAGKLRSYEGTDGKTYTELVCDFVIKMPDGAGQIARRAEAQGVPVLEDVDDGDLPF